MRVPDKSIVLINNDQIRPNWIHPWIINDSTSGTGTGFIVSHDTTLYIVTNAHCVRFSKTLSVFRRGLSVPFKARIIISIEECDLAILTCDDPKFWIGLEPLPIGGMPVQMSKLYAIGYPIYTGNISITKGIVSRYIEYAYTKYTIGIVIQIDAALNPGNSGGPVLNRAGKVVGIAQGGIPTADSMGWMIPTFILQYVLRCIKTGFSAFSSLGIKTQSFQNQTMHELFGADNGMLVTASNNSLIKPMDIIQTINGKLVQDDGSMLLTDVLDLLQIHIESDNDISVWDAVVGFKSALSILPVGTSCELGIIRDKKPIVIKSKLSPAEIGPAIFPNNPEYYIFMGMVFTPNSQPLHEAASAAGYDCPSMPGIVVSEVLLNEYIVDFDVHMNLLQTINDEPVETLIDLDRVLKKYSKKSKFLIFKFHTTKLAVIKTSDIIHDQEILDENAILKPIYLIR